MKLLIHGCGYIGEVHLKTILNFRLAEVAVCEANPQRLAEIVARYNVKESYAALDEALKNPFDGAIICTPNFLHREDAKACLRAGLNVMLEKPMSESVASSKAIAEASDQMGKFVFVAYCLRFAKPYQEMKRIIQSGALGKVFAIRASVAGKKAIADAKTDYRTKKNLGGGVIADFSHEIDYALWFAGKPAIRAIASGARAVHKDWDVHDTAEIIIQCEEDIALSIHMDFLQPYFGRSIEVYGTRGAIRYRDNECIKLYLEKEGEWRDVPVEVNWDHTYRDEIRHFIHCLRGTERPVIDAHDGYIMTRLIDECVVSAEANGIFA